MGYFSKRCHGCGGCRSPFSLFNFHNKTKGICPKINVLADFFIFTRIKRINYVIKDIIMSTPDYSKTPAIAVYDNRHLAVRT
ncbi:hypothetical protein FQO02_19640, partial [Salmonella enterica]|nr:hypothetical protein [Salmonella enterica]EBP3987728.1 hypothetical protein [Salmonella enterica subsp. enterica]EBX0544709.1 hypothetical protein [Salmonella enterica subsp. houtenae serovar 44:z4,z23:-]ECZ5471322.1 hypothetical protein [Salmonella enterica subsp. houtenae]EDG3665540.1 hypothetical protein [Salmonella enterica subsp. enterica serovar Give]EDP9794992.1 hypothetical protein [Salmonella enterica subsp. salamae]EEE0988828.1 hypothetical protein [Salmonella enterica subsp. ent